MTIHEEAALKLKTEQHESAVIELKRLMKKVVNAKKTLEEAQAEVDTFNEETWKPKESIGWFGNSMVTLGEK